MKKQKNPKNAEMSKTRKLGKGGSKKNDRRSVKPKPAKKGNGEVPEKVRKNETDRRNITEERDRTDGMDNIANCKENSSNSNKEEHKIQTRWKIKDKKKGTKQFCSNTGKELSLQNKNKIINKKKYRSKNNDNMKCHGLTYLNSEINSKELLYEENDVPTGEYNEKDNLKNTNGKYHKGETKKRDHVKIDDEEHKHGNQQDDQQDDPHDETEESIVSYSTMGNSSVDMENVPEEEKKINYITYIKTLNKEKETELNKELEKEKKVMNTEIQKKKKKKIFKIFLLFSPLDILTNLKNGKRCLINADDHLQMFEEKRDNLEIFLHKETNNHKKINELKRKLENVKRNLQNIRSDILFFTLLSLRDSILNKEKQLQIYIHTINNILIYVSSEFRVPRNFRLFSKIMTTLLTKGIVYDNTGQQVLLQVISIPIRHYAGDSVCVGVSNGGFPTDVKKFADKVKECDEDFSFFFFLSNMSDVAYMFDTRNEQTRTSSITTRGDQYKYTCHYKTTDIPFHYFIRISDLHLPPAVLCSKVMHFLST